MPSKQFTGRFLQQEPSPREGAGSAAVPVMDAKDTGAKLPPPGGGETADEEKGSGVRGRKRQREERSGGRDRWW